MRWQALLISTVVGLSGEPRAGAEPTGAAPAGDGAPAAPAADTSPPASPHVDLDLDAVPGGTGRPPPPAKAAHAAPEPEPGERRFRDGPPNVIIRRMTDEERTANNGVYLEGLGPALEYSLNYDRVFGDFAARLGVGVVPGKRDAVASSPKPDSTTEAVIVAVPATFSYIGSGSKWSMVEVGAGLVVLHVAAGVKTAYVSRSNSPVTTVVATGLIGYRFQEPHGGFLLRLGLSPLISRFGPLPFWPYLAAGATF